MNMDHQGPNKLPLANQYIGNPAHANTMQENVYLYNPNQFAPNHGPPHSMYMPSHMQETVSRDSWGWDGRVNNNANSREENFSNHDHQIPNSQMVPGQYPPMYGTEIADVPPNHQAPAYQHEEHGAVNNNHYNSWKWQGERAATPSEAPSDHLSDNGFQPIDSGVPSVALDSVEQNMSLMAISDRKREDALNEQGSRYIDKHSWSNAPPAAYPSENSGKPWNSSNWRASVEQVAYPAGAAVEQKYRDLGERSTSADGASFSDATTQQPVFSVGSNVSVQQHSSNRQYQEPVDVDVCETEAHSSVPTVVSPKVTQSDFYLPPSFGPTANHLAVDAPGTLPSPIPHFMPSPSHFSAASHVQDTPPMNQVPTEPNRVDSAAESSSRSSAAAGSKYTEPLYPPSTGPYPGILMPTAPQQTRGPVSLQPILKGHPSIGNKMARPPPAPNAMVKQEMKTAADAASRFTSLPPAWTPPVPTVQSSAAQPLIPVASYYPAPMNQMNIGVHQESVLKQSGFEGGESAGAGNQGVFNGNGGGYYGENAAAESLPANYAVAAALPAGDAEAQPTSGDHFPTKNAPPIASVRSQSGTPSMERENERPDAEGGYENDLPTPLANPTVYSQVSNPYGLERKAVHESPAGSRPASRQASASDIGHGANAPAQSSSYFGDNQNGANSYPRPKLATGFPATVAPSPMLPPTSTRGSQEAVGSEFRQSAPMPPVSRMASESVQTAMLPPSSQRMIPGSGSQDMQQYQAPNAAPQQTVPHVSRPAGPTTPVTEQRIVTGYAKNDPPVAAPLTSPSSAPQQDQDGRSNRAQQAHRSETIGSENPRVNPPINNQVSAGANNDREEDRGPNDREHKNHDSRSRNERERGSPLCFYSSLIVITFFKINLTSLLNN